MCEVAGQIGETGSVRRPTEKALLIWIVEDSDYVTPEGLVSFLTSSRWPRT